MITENSKTDKFHIFRLILAGKLDVKNPKKKHGISLYVFIMSRTSFRVNPHSIVA